MQDNKDNFQPYIKAGQSISEFSVRAIILGIILAVVFGAANAYVGLKVGMTVSASIPAAVISMAILRGVLRKGTVLENNMVQTIGSSGESLAAGVIFTVPALIFLGVSPSILEIFIMSALGGCLGILFMIPLRKYLIVREHSTLPYPEGTACAKILVAGQEGGSKAKLVFGGVIIGGLYKFLMIGLGLWKDVVGFKLKLSNNPAVQTSLGAEVTPILLGVGYIIGLRIAALMFAGAVLGWLVLIPIIQFIGANLTAAVPPATNQINQLDATGIWKAYVRYIGAGAVLLGGIVSLLKSLPIVISSIKQGFSKLFNKQAESTVCRTDNDIKFKYIVLISVLTIIGAIAYLVFYKPDSSWPKGLIGVLLIMVLGGLFITVASRIVGIVGSSSSPVSGMTITTLVVVSLIFVAFGWTNESSMIIAMSIGAIVCIAVCMAGDISQDLKTGYLVGATPYKQQIAEFIGVLAPALVIAWVLLLLHTTYGLGSEGQLQAPQATLMHIIVKGVISQELPWVLLLIGIFIGACIEFMGISSLPFAIGLYLPFTLSAPIIIGGLVAGLVSATTKKDEFEQTNEKGILFSSGLVAGDALIGIILALLASVSVDKVLKLRDEIPDGPMESLLGFGLFIALAIGLIVIVKLKGSPPEAGLTGCNDLRSNSQ
ncbi:MAG: oligopeptide transporter, OPT family [Planctomycetota bacterium]